MARLYSNENLPLPTVEALRTRGHDVLTSYEAGNANKRVTDLEVLRFATLEKRAVVTLNRRDFIALHKSRSESHGGIVICKQILDFGEMARRIDEAIRQYETLTDELVNVVSSP